MNNTDRTRRFPVGGVIANLTITILNGILFYSSAVLVTKGFERSSIGFRLLIVALIPLKFLVSYWIRASIPSASKEERRLFRKKTFKAMLSHFRYFDETADTVDATTLIGEGIESLELYRGFFFPQFITGIVAPLLICGMVMFFDLPSGLILLAFAPLTPLLVNLLRIRFRTATEQYYDANAQLVNQFREGILGLFDLSIFGQTRTYGKELERAIMYHKKTTMGLLVVNQLLIFLMDLTASLGSTIAATGISLWRYRSGAIDASVALFIILVSIELNRPLQLMGAFFFAGMGGRVVLQRLKEILSKTVRKTHIPLSVVFPESRKAIKVDHLFYRNPEGKTIFQGISFLIPEGKIIGLTGPSGCGKSTLAKVINGICDAQEGKIYIDGRDLSSYPFERRNLVGLVEQYSYLFPGSLRDNLKIVTSPFSETVWWEMLEHVGLASFIQQLPDGLDTPIGEEGRLLSGGQRSRFALVRMLLRDTPYLILDEITAELDNSTENTILKLIQDLAQRGKGILFISHRISSLSICDRVMYLHEGTIT